MPRSRRQGGKVSTGLPARWMPPASGVTKPPIMFSVVVLPHPLGPSSVTNSPCRTIRSIGPTVTEAPKCFVRPRSSSAASGMPVILVNEVANPDEPPEQRDQGQRHQQRNDRKRRQCG